eukprot:667744-Pyramimonas_sp.AAC.1
MLSWVASTHAACGTEAFGGAPYGTTKRCLGWHWRMRPVPLETSVELPVGPRNAAMGGADAWDLCHWSLR